MFSLSALLTFSEWVGFLPFYKISRGFHAENPHVFADSFRKFGIRVSNKTQAFFYTSPSPELITSTSRLSAASLHQLQPRFEGGLDTTRLEMLAKGKRRRKAARGGQETRMGIGPFPN